MVCCPSRCAPVPAAKALSLPQTTPTRADKSCSCPPPILNIPNWRPLLDELADKPGRALIDLTETCARAARSTGAGGDEVIFLPREIKGLERATVLVYGLEATFRRARQLCEPQNADDVARFEARRLFDEIRVALSRSTDKMILLEPADAEVLAALKVAQLPGNLRISWDDLLETLRNEELSAIEVIEGYLDETEELLAAGRWEQGLKRNRRAYELAVQVGDGALQRTAQEQYILEGFVQQAQSRLDQDEWRAAFALNRQAHTLAEHFGDPLVLDAVQEQLTAIATVVAGQAQNQLAEAQTQATRGHYRAALEPSCRLRLMPIVMVVAPSSSDAKTDQPR